MEVTFFDAIFGLLLKEADIVNLLLITFLFIFYKDNMKLKRENSDLHKEVASVHNDTKEELKEAWLITLENSDKGQETIKELKSMLVSRRGGTE